MGNHVVPVRNRVRVTSYGPFRGLEGTVQIVDQIADDLEEPFCFYLIALEGASIPQPIWFESLEVEFIDALAALQPSLELSAVMSAQN
ncbi:MAG TPA: hypothetical protein VNE38_15175 [Ktedonobacteraceae bacterium]|nr:hypothetical protein [Ktedonobacteraceae bacterium]